MSSYQWYSINFVFQTADWCAQEIIGSQHGLCLYHTIGINVNISSFSIIKDINTWIKEWKNEWKNISLEGWIKINTWLAGGSVLTWQI